MNFQGEIETHITLAAKDVTLSADLAQWAESRDLKYGHIVLTQGQNPSQPMFTRQSNGTLQSELVAAQELVKEIEEFGFEVTRIKLEVPPWNEDVPKHDGHVGFQCYFEHHVKLLIPSDADLIPMSKLISPWLAQLSRNARRIRQDGQNERFVTQRCYRSGRRSAHASLEKVLEIIDKFGYPILEVEEEYVIYDSNLALDAGWSEYGREIGTDSTYPNTLRVLNPDHVPDRPQIFEPAMRHFPNAFQLGENPFLSSDERSEIASVSAEVRNHILTLVSGTKWKDHLILRGSTLMQCWFGDRAREPKDIDWVFQPATVHPTEPIAQECMRGLIEAVHQNRATNNAEILTSRIATDEIWTYERAEGRRIIFPFVTSKGIEREIQMDIVWNETLFDIPIEVSFPLDDSISISLWTATAEESLCWKLIWLITDSFPQGKDLYDAVLLAEHTSLSTEFVQHVLHAINMDEPYYSRDKSLGTILENSRVDWENFKIDYPWITGEYIDWYERLRRALKPHLKTVYIPRQ